MDISNVIRRREIKIIKSNISINGKKCYKLLKCNLKMLLHIRHIKE
jgi:hypothetical protein